MSSNPVDSPELQALPGNSTGLVGWVTLRTTSSSPAAELALESCKQISRPPFLWHAENGAVGCSSRGPAVGGGIVRDQYRVLVFTGNPEMQDDTLIRIVAGDEWAISKLNACFALAVWNRQTGELWLATDRYGTLPIHYYWDGERIVFASEAKVILQVLGKPAILDRLVLGEFLWFGHTISDETLFQGIRRVPPATVIRFSTQGVSEQRYWQLTFTPAEGKHAERRIIEQAGDAFQAAVSRGLDRHPRVAVALSGGLDSRAVFSAALASGREFGTFTTGVADAADVQIARRLSRYTPGRHWECIVDQEFLIRFPDYARRLVILGEGSMPLQEAHLVQQVEWTTERFSNIVEGSCAEPMKRAYLRRIAAQLKSHDDLQYHLFHHWGERKFCQLVLEPDEFQKVEERIRTQQMTLFKQVLQSSVGDTIDAFFLRASWPYRFGPQVQLQNSYLNSFLPFADYRVMDAAACLPVRLRARACFHFWVVARNAPQLQRFGRVFADVVVPWSDDYLLKYALPAFDRALRRMGMKGLARPNLHFARWWRNELKHWVVDHIEQLVRRKVFDPQRIRRLITPEAMHHREFDLVASRLAIVELWHQVFVDQPVRALVS